jgi:hypothetical protein
MNRPVRRGREWAELVQRSDDLSADMAFSQSGQVLWNLVQRYNLRNCRTDLGPFHERNHFRSHFGQILLLAPELPRNEHTSQTNIVNRDRVGYFINSRQIRQTGDKGHSSLWPADRAGRGGSLTYSRV